MPATMAPAKAQEGKVEIERVPTRELRHPFDLLRQWTREMDHMFTDFFGRGFPRAWRLTETAGWAPDIEVSDRDGRLTVRADLPGLKKEDVKFEILDGVLTVSGERKQEKEERGEGYFVTERSYGQFTRSFTLPEGVKEEDVKATFTDGVLEITLPHAKMEPRAGREVKIN